MVSYIATCRYRSCQDGCEINAENERQGAVTVLLYRETVWNTFKVKVQQQAARTDN